jgi:hypothetical protein
MNTEPDTELDADISRRVSDKYYYSDRLKQLFSRLWREIKTKCPKAECRGTQRYIGFYASAHKSSIFAYVDLQHHGIELGVFLSHFSNFKPKALQIHSFPDWNSRGLVGLTVHDDNVDDIVAFLRAAYSSSRH